MIARPSIRLRATEGCHIPTPVQAKFGRFDMLAFVAIWLKNRRAKVRVPLRHGSGARLSSAVSDSFAPTADAWLCGRAAARQRGGSYAASEVTSWSPLCRCSQAASTAAD